MWFTLNMKCAPNPSDNEYKDLVTDKMNYCLHEQDVDSPWDSH